MHLNFTEQELYTKFMDMGTKEIVQYLMEEGLTLRSSKDFSDLPSGVYRRELGTDLVRFNGTRFNVVNIYGHEVVEDHIEWACFDYTTGDGDWWVHVLSDENEPIHTIDRTRFRMNNDGDRLE